MTKPKKVPLQPVLVAEDVAAAEVGCTVANIRAMRHKGNGPPFYKINRMVRYDLNEVKAWLAAKRVTSTSQRAA